MNDNVLGFLREARAAVLNEMDFTLPPASRELGVVLTNIDTAILWRQQDLQLKEPVVNGFELSPEEKIAVLFEKETEIRKKISEIESDIYQKKFDSCDHNWIYVHRIHGSDDLYRCTICSMEDIH